MLEIKSDKQLVLRDPIMIQGIPELDHYYAFNIENGDHFKLNHTAHWVLEAIGSGVTLAELTSKFTEAFELIQEIAEMDLAEIIDFALENNIIKEI